LTYHTQSQDHAAPEEHVVQQSAAADPLAPLNHDNGHLKHHGKEAIASELSCNATHDQLMRKRGDEKGDGGRKWSRHVVLRGRVDMATEEVMNWLVPFTGEFEPIAAVPPVCVELTIRKACDIINGCSPSGWKIAYV
jgi:hypothetical protein